MMADHSGAHIIATLGAPKVLGARPVSPEREMDDIPRIYCWLARVRTAVLGLVCATINQHLKTDLSLL